MNRRHVLATTNRGKIREIRGLLEGLPIELVGLDAFPPIEPPEETGTTFSENAGLKARYYASATGLPAIADDSGLEIDVLGGGPGVESARYGGAHATYPERFALIYDALRLAGLVTSPARFVCVVALAERDRIAFEARGTVEGRIAPAPAGTGGFGYDPIFFFPPLGKTLAEATQAEKDAISHRGEAFRALARYLSGAP
jgi:XTP/dITP diphosphohydrolase